MINKNNKKDEILVIICFIISFIVIINCILSFADLYAVDIANIVNLFLLNLVIAINCYRYRKTKKLKLLMVAFVALSVIIVFSLMYR